MMKIVDAINLLGEFCGVRDVPELTQDALEARYGFRQADVMVLFGGSILEGGHVLAKAVQSGVAKRYLIVGGEGHTTQSLRDRVHAEYPGIDTDGQPESKVFAAWLKEKYNLDISLLEERSTNCGNNITNMLELLRRENIPAKSVILAQDASMQRRMDAGLRKHGDPEMTIVNYATYRVRAVEDGENLTFETSPEGMWSMERYVTLLMGEIPRLRDAEGGYGPKGSGFIAHVEIPEAVEEAFSALQTAWPERVRIADARWATR